MKNETEDKIFPEIDDPITKLTTSGTQSETLKEIPTFITLEPFNPPKRNEGKKKYKPNKYVEEFNQLFGYDSWKRFLVLKTEESELKKIELECLLLKEHATRDLTFKRQDPKTWLIETTTQEQSETFRRMKKLGEHKVTVTENENLNSVEGTVVLSLTDYDEKDEMPKNTQIKESLRSRGYNVKKVETYEIPSKKTGKTIKIAKITFEGQYLPRNVKIEGMNKAVRPYVPKPLQCKGCSRFGHSIKNCKNKLKVCAFCSSSNHSTKWNCCEEPKCINCGENHHARSKSCTFYKYNVELQLLVNRSIFGIREAKKELAIRGIKDPAQNKLYASTLKHKPSIKNIKIPSEVQQERKLNPVPQQTISIPKGEEIGKHIVITTADIHNQNENEIKTLNKYSVLSEEEGNEENLDSEMSENNVSKRQREEETSLSNKKQSVTSTPVGKASVKPKSLKSETKKEQTDLQKNQALNKNYQLEIGKNKQITPSPVITTKITNNYRLTNKNIESVNINNDIKESNSNAANNHHETCGCHECFIIQSNKMKNMNVTELANSINSFIKNKKLKNDDSPINHKKGCLCVEHLKTIESETKANLETLLKNAIEKEEVEELKTIFQLSEATGVTEQMDSENIVPEDDFIMKEIPDSAVNLHNQKPLT